MSDHPTLLGRALVRFGARRRPSPDSPAEAEVRRHLARITASQEFTGASRLQQFLEYVVDQRLKGAAIIKETELAINVFGRRSSFDPSGDSVVRVAASNLRRRLRDYYLGTGVGDAVVIDIPKGSYVPEFRAASQAAPLPSRRIWVIAAAGALCLAALGAVLWLRPSAPDASIAVLPFRNLGGGTEGEAVADTLVEEVTTTLAQVGSLRVAARTSAFQFRAPGFDVRQAGERLGVRTLLEGSIRLDGARVHINAQLVQASNGFHLWSRSWDEPSANLHRVQQELSRGVAAALGCGPSRAAAAPKDSETYALYLKGKYFQMLGTPAGLDRSVELLTAAIARDPDYAPAHAALADSFATQAYREHSPEPAQLARAKLAATRALSLDDSQAEAHAVLAWIRYFYEWDWAGSEAGLRRALELNPNSARSHDWYAQRLMAEGRMEESLREGRRAQVLDPLNYRAVTNVAVVLYCSQHYQEALKQARQALELHAHFAKARTLEGISLQELGRLPEARTALRASMAEDPSDTDTIAHLAVVERALGNAAEAERLAGLVEHPAEGEPSRYDLAYLHLSAGRRDQAIAQLQRSLAQRSSDMPVLGVDPVFRPLHGSPEFRSLRQQMGWKQ